MTLQKLKEQVLRGSHISKEEAEWLAVQRDKEALYEAAHEITREMCIRDSPSTVAGVRQQRSTLFRRL